MLCERVYSYLQTEKSADDEDWIVAHDGSRFLFPFYLPGDDPTV